jgi:lysine 2,3-aminomutase
MDTPAWYTYSRTALIEPDWRRLPGWRDVTPTQWRDPQWQRAHCVKNPAQLRDVVGGQLAESVFADLAADIAASPPCPCCCRRRC